MLNLHCRLITSQHVSHMEISVQKNFSFSICYILFIDVRWCHDMCRYLQQHEDKNNSQLLLIKLASSQKASNQNIDLP